MDLYTKDRGHAVILTGNYCKEELVVYRIETMLKTGETEGTINSNFETGRELQDGTKYDQEKQEK